MRRIYYYNKPIKNNYMGCGCKNKNNGAPAPQQPAPQGSSTSQTQTSNQVQESIRKVVEKYYKK